MKGQILVVDDDKKICSLVASLLRRGGYDVTYALNVKQAIDVGFYLIIDLIITDVMMPEISGHCLVSSIREGKTNYKKNIPIIMVSALYETQERIEGIKVGADDYLVKPFEPEELLVRLHSLLRRHPPLRIKGRSNIKDGNIIFDLEKGVLNNEGKLLELNEKEAQLLMILMSNINTPVSRHDIIRQVYPENINSPDSRSIDIMISRLRKKLEKNGIAKIVNKRGDGYYWQSI